MAGGSLPLRLALSGWLIALLVSTVSQSVLWRSPLAVWDHASETSPQKPRVWVNYGLALYGVGDIDGADTSYKRAIITAARRTDEQQSITMAAMHLAFLACTRGQHAEVAEWWKLVDASVWAELREEHPRYQRFETQDICGSVF